MPSLRVLLRKPFMVIHIIKTLLAILIGFVVMSLVHDPHRLWILMSVIVVMITSHSIGVHLERSLLRIIGTIIGAICGMGVILLPHLWIIKFLSLGVFSLIFLTIGELVPRWRYGVILCLITFVLIIGTAAPTVGMAVERATDIILGVVIALVVSLLIRPVSSSKVIHAAFKANWETLSQYAVLIFSQDRDHHTHREVTAVEYDIKKRLALQRETLDAIDIRGRHLQREKLQRRYYLQSAIQRYLSVIETVLRRYYTDGGETQVVFNDWRVIGQALNKCLEALAQGELSKEACDAYQSAVACLHHETLRAMNDAQDSIDAASTVRFSLYRMGVVLRLLSQLV